MFWKNTTQTKELFTYESCNFRSSYRVYPSEGEPISLYINDKEEKIVDIGAGGVSFVNNGFEHGNMLSALISLPYANQQIEVEMAIVRLSDEGTAHCAFRKITDHDTEMIHKYMLKKQKQELREKRREAVLEKTND